MTWTGWMRTAHRRKIERRLERLRPLFTDREFAKKMAERTMRRDRAPEQAITQVADDLIRLITIDVPDLLSAAATRCTREHVRREEE